MSRMRGVLLGVVLALAIAATGCGGDSSSGETTKKKDVFYPWVHGPSREFLVRGGDNLIQYYGREADPVEREVISRMIHKWMRARAAEDWVEDCSYFSRAYRKIITSDAFRVTGGKARSCPDALEYFGESASGDGVNTLTGPIDSVRMKGKIAYAQWHGLKGRDWILSLEKEGGKWAVSIAAPIDRNK